MNYNGLLDINLLEDYLDGKLDGKTMHQVEKLSLEDPFVAEALAGLSQSPLRSQSLSLLQKQLHERVALKPVEAKRWTITAQRLSIASAAAVLFITVSILFWMKENNNREQITANTSKKVDVAIAAKLDTEKPTIKAKTEVERVIAKSAMVSMIKSPNVPDKSPKSSISVRQGRAVSQDNTTLNEVVVTAATSERRMVDRVYVRPEPVNGWDKFEAYVLENNKLLIDKKLTGRFVSVYFDLDNDGNPINLKTFKSFNMVPIQTEAEENEAIRLVKEGPKWFFQPNSGSSPTNTSVNIKF